MKNIDYMKRAIELSIQNIKNNGGPFGCIIVKENKIIAEGVNRVTFNNDPTAHAEIIAIRNACKKLNTFNLEKCELYTSCEPCPMCLSAIYWSHIDKIYYGNSRLDASKIGFDDDFIKIVEECFKTRCPSPFIGFGHSMGGCLLASYFISEKNVLEKCILCAPMVSVRANAMSRRIVKLLGLLDNIGYGSFPMQKPSWDSEDGWIEEPFEENALTTDRERFERSFKFLKKCPELGVKGITVGWLKHALNRTNQFKKIQWNIAIKRPLLLLDATEDKLVNSHLNKELLGQSDLVEIKSLKSQHEIMMETDEIRDEAWKSIDNFLNS